VGYYAVDFLAIFYHFKELFNFDFAQIFNIIKSLLLLLLLLSSPSKAKTLRIAAPTKNWSSIAPKKNKGSIPHISYSRLRM
jgi:hypothetical protein